MRQIQSIFPNDLIPQKAIGMDLPFNGEAIFKPNYLTKDAIKSNLINFLLTNPGERVFNPTFGAGLRDFIFEQMSQNNLDFLKEDLERKIQEYFNNIQITNLEILGTPSLNSIDIKFSYNIINTNIEDTLQINFQ